MSKRSRDTTTKAKDVTQPPPIFDINHPLHKQILVLCHKVSANFCLSIPDVIQAAADLLVCLHCKSVAANPTALSMPPLLDQFWHELILETELYAQICASIGSGCFIHHTKSTAADPVDIKNKRVNAMEMAIRLAVSQWSMSPVLWKREDAPDKFSIYVKGIDGSTVTLQVSGSMLISALKDAIALAAKVPQDEQRLIYAGNQMEDGRTLQSYGIGRDATIHLVKQLRGC